MIHSHKKSIYIVDDHPIVRQGLKMIINQQEDLFVCGESEDATSGLQCILDIKPDFAIIDISLKESDGIELVKNIKPLLPNLPILILSMHKESYYAERSLRAGANGYIMKREAFENVLEAIRVILSGKIYVSDDLSYIFMKKMFNSLNSNSDAKCSQLSDRELEIFRYIGDGKSTREISEILGISIKTVETHRSNIKRKLNLTSATELVKCAIQWGDNV